jgi:hypothetical protein
MKVLISIISIMLAGCATQPPSPKFDPLGSAVPNCLTARTQIPYLEQQIAVFKTGRGTAPETDDDRKYIARIKNIIWSLRSTCPAAYL